MAWLRRPAQRHLGASTRRLHSAPQPVVASLAAATLYVGRARELTFVRELSLAPLSCALLRLQTSCDFCLPSPVFLGAARGVHTYASRASSALPMVIVGTPLGGALASVVHVPWCSHRACSRAPSRTHALACAPRHATPRHACTQHATPRTRARTKMWH